MKATLQSAEQIKLDWQNSGRWKGVTRPYSAEDVVRLRGTVPVEHSLAKLGAEKLWRSLQTEDFVNALGALTGNQAMQQVKAGLKAIYLSGWQVAADANLAGEMYPDQSLYPANSVPQVVKRINRHAAARRPAPSRRRQGRHRLAAADRRRCRSRFRRRAQRVRADEGDDRSRRAGVHFEDQLASVKKCGHMGGKVLVPTREAIEKLVAARLAADVMGVPTLLVARTDAEAADLRHLRCRRQRQAVLHRRAHRRRLLQDAQRSRPGRSRAASPTRRTRIWSGAKPASPISNSRANLPKRSTPSIPASCSPTTARRRSTGRRISTTPPSRNSRRKSPTYGYKFQFITLAGFHALNYSMFNLAHGYARRQMSAFVELQEAEFAAADMRLHRGEAPARSRHRLLRHRHADHPGRAVLDDRAEGLDRGRAVPERQRRRWLRRPDKPVKLSGCGRSRNSAIIGASIVANIDPSAGLRDRVDRFAGQ